jgi:WD40 repeat protein
VQDACIVENTAVIGYEFSGDVHEPCQLSVVHLREVSSQSLPSMLCNRNHAQGEKPRRIDVAQQAHHIVHENFTTSARRNRGISSLAAIGVQNAQIRVVSGGRDGYAYLWTIKANSGRPGTQIEKLTVEHHSAVRALAYCPSKGTLLSAAGKTLSVSSMTTPQTLKTMLMSNDINQIHVHHEKPEVVLLEV